MILGEKKTFETKSARQFSRFVPSFNPVCLSVQLCRMVLNLEAVCALLKTDPVRTAIFSKPWPQTFELDANSLNVSR